MSRVTTCSRTTPRRITAIVWTLLQIAAQQGLAGHVEDAQLLEEQSSQSDSRWVVMTTTSPPTEAVKALAAIPGWKLVVVANQRTPKDWTMDGALDGVDFLDLERQQSLGYSIIPLLPDNHLA